MHHAFHYRHRIYCLMFLFRARELGVTFVQKNKGKKKPTGRGTKGSIFFNFNLFGWVACCFYFKVSFENLLKIDPTYSFPLHLATPYKEPCLQETITYSKGSLKEV